MIIKDANIKGKLLSIARTLGKIVILIDSNTKTRAQPDETCRFAKGPGTYEERQ